MGRDELLDTVARMGGRLKEMRLDTYVDISQAMVRYLELIKVAALIERHRDGEPLPTALREINELEDAQLEAALDIQPPARNQYGEFSFIPRFWNQFESQPPQNPQDFASLQLLAENALYFGDVQSNRRQIQLPRNHINDPT